LGRQPEQTKGKVLIVIRLSVFVAVLFVVGIAVSQAVLVNTPMVEATSDEALSARGLELYLSNSCGVCHVSSKANTKGTFGPSHDGLSVIALARIQDPNYKGKATTAEAYISESLLEPGIYLTPPYSASRYKMPAFIALSEDDIKALTYFLLQP
jgi:mono/diheme cytochrome c family protein